MSAGVGIVQLSFQSYFHASYYGIGIPCKLLPQGYWDHESLLAAYFCIGPEHFKMATCF